ncbi:MAG: hypothetical protein AB1490_06855 [Pseudomonadota bacterium]
MGDATLWVRRRLNSFTFSIAVNFTLPTFSKRGADERTAARTWREADDHLSSPIREEFSAAETSRTGKLKITRRAMVGSPDQRHARVRGSALVAAGFHCAAAENLHRYFFLDIKAAMNYINPASRIGSLPVGEAGCLTIESEKPAQAHCAANAPRSHRGEIKFFVVE